MRAFMFFKWQAVSRSVIPHLFYVFAEQSIYNYQIVISRRITMTYESFAIAALEGAAGFNLDARMWIGNCNDHKLGPEISI
jgi:hypothetical protein